MSVSLIKDIIYSISCGNKLRDSKSIIVSEIVYAKINKYTDVFRCMDEVRAYDDYTYKHCINTAFYSMLIGRWLGLQESKVQKLILSGLLHDIGKVRIPIEILNKNGKLTDEEFELIKKHTIYGNDMLNEVSGVDHEVRRAVLFHHERLNCSGYPLNASTDTIGLYAKIVAIADVYDAMTSDRVYKKGATPFEAFELLKTEGEGLFDATILYTFINNISKYYLETEATLLL